MDLLEETLESLIKMKIPCFSSTSDMKRITLCRNLREKVGAVGCTIIADATTITASDPAAVTDNDGNDGWEFAGLGKEDRFEAEGRAENGLVTTPSQLPTPPTDNEHPDTGKRPSQAPFSRIDNEKPRRSARLPARQTRPSRQSQRTRSAPYNEDSNSPLRNTWLKNWRGRWERIGLEPPEPSPLPTLNRDPGATRWWSGGQKDYCIYVYPEKPPPRPRHGMTEEQWWFYCKDHYDQADAVRAPGEGCYWEISCLGGKWTRQLIRCPVETELEIHRRNMEEMTRRPMDLDPMEDASEAVPRDGQSSGNTIWFSG